MADIVDKATRSKMMSGIKGKNTKPEFMIRKGLFSKGFRYHIHNKNLPGKPDIVLRKYKAAIFVNGCFWHGHNCKLFKWPSSNKEFWKKKILGNRKNDRIKVHALKSKGWRVFVVWECLLRNKNAGTLSATLDKIAKWLKSDNAFDELEG